MMQLTLAEADTIIVILIFIVILLLVLGGISLYYNRVFKRRNEQFSSGETSNFTEYLMHWMTIEL